MTRARVNAGYRDGRTLRRWQSFAKPETMSEEDDAIVNEELFPRPVGQATETKVVPDPEFASIDNSRPDLPDETEDGLDPIAESVRHMAEDITTGSDYRPIGLDDDAPVEPREAIENQAEFPGLADQGEETPSPRKRRQPKQTQTKRSKTS